MNFEDRITKKDFAQLSNLFLKLINNQIGYGAYRKVYHIPHFSSVLKVEEGRPTSNVLEYETSQILPAELRKYFALCVTISDDNKFLVQEYVEPMTLETFNQINRDLLVPACWYHCDDFRINNLGIKLDILPETTQFIPVLFDCGFLDFQLSIKSNDLFTTWGELLKSKKDFLN